MPASPCSLRRVQCRHSCTALNQSLLYTNKSRACPAPTPGHALPHGGLCWKLLCAQEYTKQHAVIDNIHCQGHHMPAPPCTLRRFQCRHSRTALNQSLLGSASAATLGTGHLLRRITTASPGPNSVRSLPSNEAQTWPRASAGTCGHTKGSHKRMMWKSDAG